MSRATHGLGVGRAEKLLTIHEGCWIAVSLIISKSLSLVESGSGLVVSWSYNGVFTYFVAQRTFEAGSVRVYFTPCILAVF